MSDATTTIGQLYLELQAERAQVGKLTHALHLVAEERSALTLENRTLREAVTDYRNARPAPGPYISIVPRDADGDVVVTLENRPGHHYSGRGRTLYEALVQLQDIIGLGEVTL
jgi:hypothetical protein